MKYITLFALLFLAGCGGMPSNSIVVDKKPGHTQHSVALTWNPVSTAVSYNVYSGTTQGNYALLASAVVSTSYKDKTVLSGQTYYYVATALDNAGHESVYSKNTKATIP